VVEAAGTEVVAGLVADPSTGRSYSRQPGTAV
jgi:hypothetical protein